MEKLGFLISRLGAVIAAFPLGLGLRAVTNDLVTLDPYQLGWAFALALLAWYALAMGLRNKLNGDRLTFLGVTLSLGVGFVSLYDSKLSDVEIIYLFGWAGGIFIVSWIVFFALVLWGESVDRN
jgi:hypothetical protein